MERGQLNRVHRAMFDFGDNDKDKLKENMEDIKEMVNQGKGIAPEQQDPDLEQGFGEDSFEEASGMDASEPKPQQPDFQEDTNSPDSQATRSFDNSQSQSFDSQAADPEEQELEEELESFEEKFGGQEQQAQSPSQNTAQQPQNASRQQQPQQPEQDPREEQHRSRSEKSGVKDSRDVDSLSSEVPSPPETRDIDVPEIDRGPLFLRRQKFRRAKQLIDEMLYISSEVENTVNSLEAGIQQDQATERDVREMLKEIEDDRTGVEDIISPREE